MVKTHFLAKQFKVATNNNFLDYNDCLLDKYMQIMFQKLFGFFQQLGLIRPCRLVSSTPSLLPKPPRQQLPAPVNICCATLHNPAAHLVLNSSSAPVKEVSRGKGEKNKTKQKPRNF